MIEGYCKLCGSQKAKRICKIKEMAPICPPCCSKIRSEVCEGCSFYISAIKYNEGKQKEKKFITMINPQIDDECDNALKLVERGNITEAEKLLTELDKKHHDYHMVKYGIGVCRISQGKAEESLGYFKKAVEIFPYFIEAHFNIAAAYMKLGNIPEAVKAYREVIYIGNNDELAVEAKRIVDGMERHIKEKSGINLDTYLKNNETFNKAFAAMEGEEYKLAIDLFRLVLSRDPSHVQSWGNLGLAYACVGQKTKAIECLNKALEIDPNYELALVNKMQIEETMGEGDCIDFKGESVNYYKDYGKESKRSYLFEFMKLFWK